MINFSTIKDIIELDDIQDYLENCFCIETDNLINTIKNSNLSNKTIYANDLLPSIFSSITKECHEYNMDSYLEVLKRDLDTSFDLNLLTQINDLLPKILEHHCVIQCLYTIEFIDSKDIKYEKALNSNEKKLYNIPKEYHENGIMRDRAYISNTVNIKLDKRYWIDNFLPLFHHNLMALSTGTKYRSMLNRAQKAKKEFNHTDYINYAIKYFSQHYLQLTASPDDQLQNYNEQSISFYEMIYTYHKNRLYGFDLIKLLINTFAYQYTYKVNKDKLVKMYKYDIESLTPKKEYIKTSNDHISQIISECLTLPNTYTRKYLLKQFFEITDSNPTKDVNIIINTLLKCLTYLNNVLFPLYEQIYTFVIYKLYYLDDMTNAKIQLFDYLKSFNFGDMECHFDLSNNITTEYNFYKSINKNEFTFVKNNIFKIDDDKASHIKSVDNIYQIILNIARYQDRLIEDTSRIKDYTSLRLLAKKLSITEKPYSLLADKEIYANFLARFNSYANTEYIYHKAFNKILENQHLYAELPSPNYFYFNYNEIYLYQEILMKHTKFCRISFHKEISLLETALIKGFVPPNSITFSEQLCNYINMFGINNPYELITYPYYRISNGHYEDIKILYVVSSTNNINMTTYCNEHTVLATSEYYTYELKKDLCIISIPSYLIHKIWNMIGTNYKDILPLQFAFDIYEKSKYINPNVNGIKYNSSIGEIFIFFNLTSDDIEETVELFPSK